MMPDKRTLVVTLPDGKCVEVVCADFLVCSKGNLICGTKRGEPDDLGRITYTDPFDAIFAHWGWSRAVWKNDAEG